MSTRCRQPEKHTYAVGHSSRRSSPPTDHEAPFARQDPLLDRLWSTRYESPLARPERRVEDATIQDLGEVE